jgi:hypothetical protein
MLKPEGNNCPLGLVHGTNFFHVAILTTRNARFGVPAFNFLCPTLALLLLLLLPIANVCILLFSEAQIQKEICEASSLPPC